MQKKEDITWNAALIDSIGKTTNKSRIADAWYGTLNKLFHPYYNLMRAGVPEFRFICITINAQPKHKARTRSRLDPCWEGQK